MGFKKVSFLLACICVGLLSGCKATPETEAIAQKVDVTKVVEKSKIKEGKETIRSVVEAPEAEKFDLESKDGKSKVTVDAKVIVPDTKAVPAVKVGSRDLSKLDLEGLSNYFFEGEEYRYRRDIKDMSKAEIADFIEEQKKMMEDQSYYEGLSEEEKEMNKQAEQDYLLELQGYYDKAPETVEEKPIEYKLAEVENEEESNFWGAGAKSYDIESTQKKDSKGFSVCASQFFNSVTYYSDLNTGMFEGYFDGYENKCKYSEEEAKKICEEIVEKIGATGEYKLVRCVPTVGYSEDTMESQDYYNGYEIEYKRVVNGVDESYEMTSIMPKEEQSGEEQTSDEFTMASFPKQYETMSFYFGEEGLGLFNWMEPMTQDELLAENLKMISYNEAIKIFKDKVFLNSPILSESESMYDAEEEEIQSADAAGEEGNGAAEEINCKIKEIKLGLMRVKNKGSEEKYTLIPVWDFYGTYGEEDSADISTSYLTISALDGSIIDRSLGY